MGTSAVAWFGTLRAQASGKDDLRRLLTRASGGMLFSTLQKFAPGKDGDINPVLTDRRNVVVIADEAHRSQYGFEESLDSEGRLKAGLAKHLRDALPGATVKIFYESRLEALVGAEARLDAIAADIVAHWENRRSSMAGKAMIATMSRHIAVTLYNKITALRPKWHSEDINKGRIKIVMTGSAAAPAEFQPHFHSKDERRDLKLRAKNPDDELGSSSFATCGSPDSMRRPCTRCTWTSPCKGLGSCRQLRESTDASRTSPADSSSTTSACSLPSSRL